MEKKQQLPIGVHRHWHTEDSSQRHESTHTHTMADNNKSIWVIRIKELREFGELDSVVEKDRETTKKEGTDLQTVQLSAPGNFNSGAVEENIPSAESLSFFSEVSVQLLLLANFLFCRVVPAFLPACLTGRLK